MCTTLRVLQLLRREPFLATYGPRPVTVDVVRLVFVE